MQNHSSSSISSTHQYDPRIHPFSEFAVFRDERVRSYEIILYGAANVNENGGNVVAGWRTLDGVLNVMAIAPHVLLLLGC